MMIKEIEGDLIELALAGEFDVIAHGTNCFCLQGKGIALQMRKTFGTNEYEKEDNQYLGDINKLGQIQYVFRKTIITGELVAVVNAYTQYEPGKNLDYEALTLCLRKINHKFRGKHIGLPRIGCGIAGGDWETVRKIIEKELKDCDVTIVNYVK